MSNREILHDLAAFLSAVSLGTFPLPAALGSLWLAIIPVAAGAIAAIINIYLGRTTTGLNRSDVVGVFPAEDI